MKTLYDKILENLGKTKSLTEEDFDSMNEFCPKMHLGKYSSQPRTTIKPYGNLF